MTRLHVVGLPHTETTENFQWCAYTAKIQKFSTMMSRRGHEVYLYAGEANDAECKEHIQVVSREEQAKWFAEYDFSHDVFGSYPGAWDALSPWWQNMNLRAVCEIADRAEKGDLLCLISGLSQKPIADALPSMRAVEWGIGYEGVFSDFRAYESQAWRHHVQGLRQEKSGRFYDTVIPNFFDPHDFHLAKKDDYLLFIGRLNESKGPHVANEIARRTGRRLLVAGQGDPSLAADGEYVGVVRGKQRADLLAHAHAVLVPSLYLEPFGGVAVEAMLSGTPAITTNWGAFPETVQDGCGFRCDTLADFVAAVDRPTLRPLAIRKKALARYSPDAVAPQFEAWFDRLATLDGEGWYS